MVNFILIILSIQGIQNKKESGILYYEKREGFLFHSISFDNYDGNEIDSIVLNKRIFYPGDIIKAKVYITSNSGVELVAMSFGEEEIGLESVTGVVSPPHYLYEGSIQISKNTPAGDTFVYFEVFYSDDTYNNRKEEITISKEFKVNYEVKRRPNFPGDTLGLKLTMVDARETFDGFESITWYVYQEENLIDSSYVECEEDSTVYIEIPLRATEPGEVRVILECTSIFDRKANLERTFYLQPPPEVVIGFRVYPNPCTEDELNINLITLRNGLMRIVLFTSDGIPVLSHEEDMDSGEYWEDVFDVSELPPDIYFLFLEFTTESGERRLYKKRVGIVR